MHTKKEVTKKLFVLIGFIVLLVGLPVVLAASVGNPLPTPEQQEFISEFFQGRRTLPAELVLNLLATALWAMWTLLVIATAVEVSGFLRASKPRTFIPGIQTIVRQVMLAIPIVVAALKPVAATPLAPETRTVTEPLETKEPVASKPLGEPEDQQKQDVETEPLSFAYTTVEGDSWYSLSKQFYGSKKHFDTIRQANEGKKFDGTTITRNTEFVSAGWELEIPEKHVPRYKKVTVERNDTLWDITESNLTETNQEASGDVVAEEIQETVNHNTIENPDLIYPGQQIEIPDYANNTSETLTTLKKPENPSNQQTTTTTAPKPDPSQRQKQVTVPESADPGTFQDLPNSTAREDEDREAEIDDDSDDYEVSQRPLWPAAAAILTIIGVWYLKALRQKRRHTAKTRRSEQTDEPDATVIDKRIEVTNLLSKAEESNNAYLLEVACRAFSQTNKNMHTITVVIDNTQVHFIADPQKPVVTGIALPAEFRQVEGTNTWIFTKPADLTAYDKKLGYGTIATPTLASLGIFNNDVAAFLNLEQIQTVHVEAEKSETVEKFYEDLALELATTPLAENMRIIAVGFGEHLAALQRIEYHQKVTSDLVDDLKNNHRKLCSEDATEERLANWDTSYYDPIIVLSVLPEDTEKLLSFKHPDDTSGVITLTTGATNYPTWPIKIDSDSATLCCPQLPPPANQTVFNRQTASPLLNQTIIEELSEPPTKQPAAQEVSLQADSSEKSETTNTQAVPGNKPSSKELPKITPLTSEDLEIELLVKCLGGIEIGQYSYNPTIQPWAYSKTPELIVMVAASPQGIPKETIAKQLWPENPHDIKNGRRLTRILSDARTNILKNNNQGEPRLPRSPQAGIIKFDSSIGTDMQLFDKTVELAEQAERWEEKVVHLQNALQLVRGVPFTVPTPISGYGWDIYTRQEFIIKIENTAQQLAKIVLETHPQIALQATQKGLTMGTENYDLQDLRLQAALKLEDHKELTSALTTLQQDSYLGEPEEQEDLLPAFLQETIANAQHAVKKAAT